MDDLDKIAQMQTFMLESYRDFLSLMNELKGDRGLYNYSPSYESEELNNFNKSYSLEDSLESPEEEYNELMQDFNNEQLSFCLSDLNPDDPEFSTGKSIGIPVGLVVRTESGDRLLPIVNGKFANDGL